MVLYWYYNQALGKKWIRRMFCKICIAYNIDISGKNISKHSEKGIAIQLIFDIGNKEIKAMKISDHNLSAEIHNYFKIIKKKKKKDSWFNYAKIN
jgi:hypothetical protein